MNKKLVLVILITLLAVTEVNTQCTTAGYLTSWRASDFGSCTTSCQASSSFLSNKCADCVNDDGTVSTGTNFGCCACDPNGEIPLVDNTCDAESKCYGNGNNFFLLDSGPLGIRCSKTCISPNDKIDIGYLFFGEICVETCSSQSVVDGNGRCQCPANAPYVGGPNSHFDGLQGSLCFVKCPTDDAADKLYYYTGTNKICYENACQLGVDRRISSRVLPSYYVDLYLWPASGTGTKGACRPTCNGLNMINEFGICKCKSEYVWNTDGLSCIKIATCFEKGYRVDVKARVCVATCNRVLIDFTADPTLPDGFKREGYVYSKLVTLKHLSQRYCVTDCTTYGLVDTAGTCNTMSTDYFKLALQQVDNSLGTINPQVVSTCPAGTFYAFASGQRFCTDCLNFDYYGAVFKGKQDTTKCYDSCTNDNAGFTVNPIKIGDTCDCPVATPYLKPDLNTCVDTCTGLDGYIKDNVNKKCVKCTNKVSIDLTSCSASCGTLSSVALVFKSYNGFDFCACPATSFYEAGSNTCKTQDECATLGYFTYTDSTTGLRYCSKYCGKNMVRLWNVNICMTAGECTDRSGRIVSSKNVCKCPYNLPYYNTLTGQCVATVTTGKIQNGIVLTNCNQGYFGWWDGRACVSKCSDVYYGTTDGSSVGGDCKCTGNYFSLYSNKCIPDCNRIGQLDIYPIAAQCSITRYVRSCTGGEVTSKDGKSCIVSSSCGGDFSSSGGMCVCTTSTLKVSSDATSCVASCNADEFEETDSGRTFCVKKSSRPCDGSFSNLKVVNKATTYCEQSCPTNFEAYSYGSTCACDSSNFESVNGASCPASCTDISEKNQPLSKKCVSVCGSDFLSSDTNSCLFQCPANQKFNQALKTCYPSCGNGNPTYTDLKGEQCLTACDSEGSVIPSSGTQCATNCQSGEENQVGTCVACAQSDCCANLNQADGSCQSTCVNSKRSWFQLNAESCTTRCPQVSKSDSNCAASCTAVSEVIPTYPTWKCVPSCPVLSFNANYYFSDDGLSCIPLCSGGAKGQFTDQLNKRCYNTCPSTGISSYNQFDCLGSCSGSDLLNRLVPSGTGKVCVPYCDGQNGNDLLNSAGTQCITACDPADATDKYLSVDKTQCVSSCTLFNAEGTACLSECPEKTYRQSYNSKLYCITDCSDPCEFISTNGRDCVTSCTIYSSDFKRCLPSCNGQLKNNFPFPNPDYGSVCIEKCETDSSKHYKVGPTLGLNCICDNSYSINPPNYGDACLNTCGSGKISLSNYCIAACDGAFGNNYVNRDGTTCVTNCGGAPLVDPPAVGGTCDLCLNSWNTPGCKTSCQVSDNGFESSALAASSVKVCVKSCEGGLIDNDRYYNNDATKCIPSCGSAPDLYISVDKKSCVPACTGKVIDWRNQACLASCDGTDQNNFLSFDATKCYTVCPKTGSDLVVSSAGNSCLDACPVDELLDETVSPKRCVKVCAENQVKSGSSCLAACTKSPLIYRLPNRICVESCIAITQQAAEPAPNGLCTCSDPLPYFNKDFTACAQFSPIGTKYVHVNGIQLLDDCAAISGHPSSGDSVFPASKVCKCDLVSKDKWKCLTKCPTGQSESLDAYELLGESMSICVDNCPTATTGAISRPDYFNYTECWCNSIKFYEIGSNTCVAAFNCPVGLYHDYFTYTCQPCHSTCETCSYGSGDNQCITCRLGNYYFEGSCLGLNQCPPGTYEDNTAKKCSACHSSCLFCSGPAATQCTKCPNNFYLQPDNSCKLLTACVVGLFADVQTNTCLACSSNCNTCETVAENCLTCKASTFLLGNKCVIDCPNGYYKNSNNNRCEFCNEVCLTCLVTNKDSCINCRPGLFKSDTTCVKTCPTTSYADVLTQTCIPCNSECLTCSGPNNNNCLSCAATPTALFLNIVLNTCVVSASCPSNTYAETSPRICVPCHQSCSTCNGALNTNCLTCPSGKYLTAGKQCVVDCPTGTYANGLICSNCDPVCPDCFGSDSSKCLACNAANYLLNTNCYIKTDPIQCSNAILGSNLLSGECKPCNSVCTTCASAAESCNSCKGSFTDNNNSNCVVTGTCQSNEWEKTQEGVANTCTKCADGCVKCEGKLDFCTECAPGKFREDGKCLNCPSSLENCETCSGALACTKCKDKFYLLQEDSTCVASCPATSFLYQDICRSCAGYISNCQECTSGTYCNLCAPGYFISLPDRSKCIPCTDSSQTSIDHQTCFEIKVTSQYSPTLRNTQATVQCGQAGFALLALGINEGVVKRIPPSQILQKLGEKEEVLRAADDPYWLQYARKSLSGSFDAQFTFTNMRADTTYTLMAYCTKADQSQFSRKLAMSSWHTADNDVKPLKIDLTLNQPLDVEKQRISQCVLAKNLGLDGTRVNSYNGATCDDVSDISVDSRPSLLNYTGSEGYPVTFIINKDYSKQNAAEQNDILTKISDESVQNSLREELLKYVGSNLTNVTATQVDTNAVVSAELAPEINVVASTINSSFVTITIASTKNSGNLIVGLELYDLGHIPPTAEEFRQGLNYYGYPISNGIQTSAIEEGKNHTFTFSNALNQTAYYYYFASTPSSDIYLDTLSNVKFGLISEETSSSSSGNSNQSQGKSGESLAVAVGWGIGIFAIIFVVIFIGVALVIKFKVKGGSGKGNSLPVQSNQH